MNTRNKIYSAAIFLHLLQIVVQVGHGLLKEHLGDKSAYVDELPTIICALLLMSLFTLHFHSGIGPNQYSIVFGGGFTAFMQIFSRVVDKCENRLMCLDLSFSNIDTVFVVQIMMMLVNLFWLVTGLQLYFFFEVAKFDKSQFTGNYAIGHKLFYTKKNGNPVSVFYPVDRSTEKKMIDQGAQYNPWVNYKDTLSFIRASAKATAWATKKWVPEYVFQSSLIVRTCALENAELAETYKTGKEQLIPVIFSHGLSMCRNHHQVIGHELASNGYILFSLDHFDDTCVYTELQNGETRVLDYSFPDREQFRFDQSQSKIWCPRILKREQEVKDLIDDILDTKFLNQVLGFGPKAKLDSDKLVMSGHSMGSATALKVGDSDPRIKLILNHDPWTLTLDPYFDDFKEIYSKPTHIASTLQIHMMDNYKDSIIKLMSPKYKDKSLLQNIVVDKTHHFQQIDLNFVDPFAIAMEVKMHLAKNKCSQYSDNHLLVPGYKDPFIYSFFIHLWLKFLYDKGFYSKSGLNINNVLKKMEMFKDQKKGEVGYIYDPAETFDPKLYQSSQDKKQQ